MFGCKIVEHAFVVGLDFWLLQMGFYWCVLVSLVCGEVCLSSVHVMDLQECREACGGQGLKTDNRVGAANAEYDVQLTFEGGQQCAYAAGWPLQPFFTLRVVYSLCVSVCGHCIVKQQSSERLSHWLSGQQSITRWLLFCSNERKTFEGIGIGAYEWTLSDHSISAGQKCTTQQEFPGIIWPWWCVSLLVLF